MTRTRVLILGAAGRDFHNFNVVYRDRAQYEVVSFTAQQIPHIAGRRYPSELAGALYPEGIPIFPEEQLEELIRELRVDRCVLAYSDVSHEEVMHLASRTNAAGADFELLGVRRTMLEASRPVVAVCASRTGAGKSPTSREVVRLLRSAGLHPVVMRHPMPYGDLRAQRVQRFASFEDLERERVTIEEREDYEPHLAAGSVVYAGVDYAAILREAEAEADVIVWDGGNNDTSFLKADVYITVVDPHRAGHELRYHPGETNLRLADVMVVSKVDTAEPAAVRQVLANIEAVNPRALVVEAACPLFVDDPAVLRDRRVLAIEDGPTVTHGGMRYGAATLAARKVGATLVDPRPYAVGEIGETFARYPEIGPLLPAMGYGEQQIRDLEATLERAVQGGVEAVAVGTPIDLTRLLRVPVPHTRVRYELQVLGKPNLEDALAPILGAPASRRGRAGRSLAAGNGPAPGTQLPAHNRVDAVEPGGREEEPMQIPLEVSYRNVEPSEAIEKRIRSGLGRLEKVCDRIVGCRVMVELPNRRRRTGNLYHVRIDVSIPGEDLVLKRNPPRHRAHEDVVQALGEAFDNARRKLVERRRRERFEVKAHEPVPEGRVSKLFAHEGYGFIATGEGREVYFHRNSVLNGGFDRLDVGTRVRFAEEAGKEGPQASTVELVGHNGRKARRAAATEA